MTVRQSLKVYATAATLLWTTAALAVAPGGIPDPAFGGVDAPPGFAIESFHAGQNDQDQAVALVETNGGMLLLAGGVTGQSPSCIGLMRFSPDGILDTGFGVEGKICHPLILGAGFQVQYEDFNAVALPDGKTLVAGNALDSSLFAFVCRFLASGARDLAFGSAETPGCRVLPGLVSSSQKDIAPILAADAQAIVVITDPSHNDIPVLTRLSQLDGSLLPYAQDTATPTLSPQTFAAATARDAAFTPDGDLLIAGVGFRNGTFVAYVSRFDMDAGTPPPTFGTGGARSIDFGSTPSSARSIRVLPTGEALIAGVVQSPDGEQVGLAQISSVNGSTDPSFNDGEFSVFRICDIAHCDIIDLQIDRDATGRLFLAGALDVLSEDSIFAARVNSDGSPDGPYGPEPERGISIFESKTDARARMVLQDGSVVLGGTLNLQQTNDFVLVRLGDEEVFADGFESVF